MKSSRFGARVILAGFLVVTAFFIPRRVKAESPRETAQATALSSVGSSGTN